MCMRSPRVDNDPQNDVKDGKSQQAPNGFLCAITNVDVSTGSGQHAGIYHEQLSYPYVGRL